MVQETKASTMGCEEGGLVVKGINREMAMKWVEERKELAVLTHHGWHFCGHPCVFQLLEVLYFFFLGFVRYFA